MGGCQIDAVGLGVVVGVNHHGLVRKEHMLSKSRGP